MSAAMREAVRRYRDEMERYFAALYDCETDEDIDKADEIERAAETDLFDAYYRETKAYNRREDCMASNPNKICRIYEK